MIIARMSHRKQYVMYPNEPIQTAPDEPIQTVPSRRCCVCNAGNPNNYSTFQITAQLIKTKILQIWSNPDWFGHNTSPALCPEILQHIWSYISGMKRAVLTAFKKNDPTHLVGSNRVFYLFQHTAMFLTPPQVEVTIL
jgi:hypothetical protein